MPESIYEKDPFYGHDFRVKEIRALLEEVERDYEKGVRGNRDAGKRARKLFSEIRRLCTKARAEVMYGIKLKRGKI